MKYLGDDKKADIQQVFKTFKVKLDEYLVKLDGRGLNTEEETPFRQQVWKLLVNV
jgi:hypothetical protein